jgi:hypothetical protein
MVGGPRAVVRGQRAVVSGQLSVVRGQHDTPPHPDPLPALDVISGTRRGARESSLVRLIPCHMPWCPHVPLLTSRTNL